MMPAMRKGKKEAASPAKGRVPRLLVEERRRRILELLEEQERVTVEELVTRFSVSAVTIRGDLDALADIGAVVRSHGGALKRGDPGGRADHGQGDAAPRGEGPHRARGGPDDPGRRDRDARLRHYHRRDRAPDPLPEAALART